MTPDIERVLHTYEVCYASGEREVIQAHSLSQSLGGFGLFMGESAEPRTFTFYRHPEGQVLIVRAADLQSIRMLDLDRRAAGEVA